MRQSRARRHNWIGGACAVLAVMVCVACGTVHAGQVANVGTLTLSASNVDFGKVAIGACKGEVITLSNAAAAGAASVTVSNATISGSGFSIKLASLPLTIAPAHSATMQIVFAPKSAGAVEGAFSVAVAGIAEPEAAGLSAVGTAPAKLTAVPNTISFGSVTLGTKTTQTGELKAGASSLTINSAQWSGNGYTISGISFPVTIPAWGSAPYTVTFLPEAAGNAVGAISFVSDAENSPTWQVLAGNGIAKPEPHGVDLKWVPSTSTVTGYNVYRATTSGGPYARLNASLQSSTAYVDNTVKAGVTYYYVATAVDADKQESIYSDEAAALVP
jgi:hypothetical protein